MASTFGAKDPVVTDSGSLQEDPQLEVVTEVALVAFSFYVFYFLCCIVLCQVGGSPSKRALVLGEEVLEERVQGQGLPAKRQVTCSPAQCSCNCNLYFRE